MKGCSISGASLACARLSLAVQREEIVDVLIGLSNAVTCCGFQPRARESQARGEYSTAVLNL